MNKTIISAVTITASSDTTSDSVMLGYMHRKHSIYFAVTGDGTLKIEYEATVDGISWVLMSTAVATGKTKTSGEQSDGVHLQELDMVPCESVRFKFSETGGVNSVTVTAILCGRLWD
jgi:hypothetical protein